MKVFMFGLWVPFQMSSSMPCVTVHITPVYYEYEITLIYPQVWTFRGSSSPAQTMEASY